MELTDVERALLESQISTDTRWCYPCSLRRGITRAADGVYAVGNNNVDSCMSCFCEQLKNGVTITSWTPIEQVGYIALLRRLMGDQ